jgi:outer membrane protein assembly factor BamB
LDTTQGICVVAGGWKDHLALRLAAASEFLVYAQLPDATSANELRREAARRGVDHSRLQVAVGPLAQLHLADNLADALIAVQEGRQLAESEALRVLRPRGRAWLAGRSLIKPVPQGIDDWTHAYHGPDNNPVSHDRLIRAPYLTQFLADPYYGPAPQLAVTAGGRLFKAFGHVAWHEREEDLLNTLVAFDGYNGRMLWRRPLPRGLMVHRNTLIATPETLYVGDHESCKLIDTATGASKGEIAPDRHLAGGSFWKWMAMQGDVLFALIGEAEPRDETMRWRREAHGWPWTGISRGYNQPKHPWGFGRTLLALNKDTGAILWRYQEEEPIDGRALCMNSNRVFAFRFGAYLTCLDAQTGEILWRKTRDRDPEFFQQIGNYLTRQGWQTNWRTACYAKCSQQALYFAGPQLEKLIAVSTQNGSILWEHPYDNFQLVLYEDAVYAISGPWGTNVSVKLDPLTGKVLAELPTGRRACTRPTATSDSILFRAMGGSIRFDLASERPRWVSPMRPPCHDGVTVANGLLYWWPYVCDCQLSLNGLTSLGAAGDLDFEPEVPEPIAGDSMVAVAQQSAASAKDWTTFRGNNRRTATTAATIPATCRVLWQAKPAKSIHFRPTAPVCIQDRVLLSGSEGIVFALDVNTGTERWRAFTGCEVRIPPTVWQGRALVGSGDGWVYAFDANTGAELWRWRAAPSDRMIPVYGKLLSTWPAASGVAVADGVAYVAAGLANYDGTYVYALDPKSGQVRWCNNSSGHLDPQANVGVGVQGHLLLNGERLYLAGGNAVSPAVYDIRDGRCLNDPAPLAQCESTSPRGWELFLVGERVIACGRPYYLPPEVPVYDHTVTKKMFHASTGQHDLVWLDNRKLLCYAPLDTDVLSRCVTDEKIARHVTQAWGQFRVEAQPRWVRDVPDSKAIAVAPNAVVVADDAHVTAFGVADGNLLWRQELPAAPVPWGMAVSRNGRVLLTLVDGRVVCLGEGND